MRKRSSIFIIIMFVVNAVMAQRQSREAYIEKYAEVAIKEMKNYGIPASITLAQGILESANGNSYLAQKANNHFGIKCHDWTGPSVRRDDDMKNECFRKYKTAQESFDDHTLFLTSRERYASLFDLKSTDYKGWAKGLKKAGYATDPKYASRLIQIIEDNELFLFDRGVDVQFTQSERISTSKRKNTKQVDNFIIQPFSMHQVYSNNKVDYIKVRPGDGFESIAQEFGLRDWELYRYNDLQEGSVLKSGQVLYIQPKRTRSKDNEYHTVRNADTMYKVAQRYGIKLRSLYRKNRMSAGTQCQEGQQLYLKKRKPKGDR